MRLFYLLIPVMILGGCKTKNATVNQSQAKTMEFSNMGACPENGNCTVEALANKKLVIKDDGTGALYPVIEDGENIVVKFNYVVEGPQGTADGGYSETIHFEIPSDTETLLVEDGSLADANVLFGRHCFCPDAGYFHVENGKLAVQKVDGKIQFDLQYQMGDVKQVLSHITHSASVE